MIMDNRLVYFDKAKNKKVLVSDYPTLCPKTPPTQTFFFNFTIDKIPNLPRAIRTIQVSMEKIIQPMLETLKLQPISS